MQEMSKMNEKRLVLIVPLKGSYQLFFSELLHSMIQRGWKIWVFTSMLERKDCYDGGIQMIHLDMPRQFEILKYIKCALIFRKHIKQIKPSIIQAHFQPAALVVFLSGCLKKITSFTTSHGLVFNTKKNLIKSFVFRFVEVNIYKKFTKLWVLTKSDKEAIQKYTPNVDVYPTKGLGCSLDKFNLSLFKDNTKRELSKKLNFKDEDFVFIFCGRLTNFKGIDITYRAFCDIQKKYKNVKLLILGDLDPIHPSGLSSNEMMNMKGNPDIKYMGVTDDVALYLSISNALIFPSNREGMPVNLMEAISMGVPIITFNSRGNIDVVSNKYGLVIDKRTVQDFAVAMELLLTNQDLYSEIKNNQLKDRCLFDRKLYLDFQINDYERCLFNQNK
jgi:glycosyltransferase involved in cell wall biosynthesis